MRCRQTHAAARRRKSHFAAEISPLDISTGGLASYRSSHILNMKIAPGRLHVQLEPFGKLYVKLNIERHLIEEMKELPFVTTVNRDFTPLLIELDTVFIELIPRSLLRHMNGQLLTLYTGDRNIALVGIENQLI